MTRWQWFSLALVTSLCLALAGPAAAQIKPGQVPIKPVPNPCPTGWKLKGPVTIYGSFQCVPNKPAPIKCPEGTEYYEKAGPGSSACEVGCQQVIAPPR